MKAARGRALGLIPFFLLLPGTDSLLPPMPGQTAAGRQEAPAIDLATVLRLAGAQNLDVQIAAQRLEEARASSGRSSASPRCSTASWPSRT